MPADEYNKAVSLIRKDSEDLSKSERDVRKLLDDLISEKISIEIYLSSVSLLRKSYKPKDKILKETANKFSEKLESKKEEGPEVKLSATQATIPQTPDLRLSSQPLLESQEPKKHNLILNLFQSIYVSKNILLKWIIFTVIGYALFPSAGLRFLHYVSPSPYIPILGTIIGFMQWIIIRNYCSRAYLWVFSSSIGWIIIYPLFYLTWYYGLEIYLSILGIIILSLLQFLFLNKHFLKAGWWLFTSTLGLIIAIYYSEKKISFFLIVAFDAPIVYDIITGIIAGIIYGAFTGITWVLLIQHPKN